MNDKYQSYLKHLCNSYLESHDNYPWIVHDAYDIRQQRETEGPPSINDNDGMVLTQCNLEHIVCFTCNEKCHYVS